MLEWAYPPLIFFWNKFVMFDQKFQNMGSLDDKFVIFDQKLKKHGAFGW